jgi:cytidine deaminase
LRAPEPAAEAALVAAARDAETRAFAPYSSFTVGAALLLADGTIVTGCNIENATYGQTMCAERVALYKALSDGHRQFAAIAITAAVPRPTPPCGACRQLLWEFCGDIPVIMANADEVTMRTTLGALLPEPFGPLNLK